MVQTRLLVQAFAVEEKEKESENGSTVELFFKAMIRAVKKALELNLQSSLSLYTSLRERERKRVLLVVIRRQNGAKLKAICFANPTAC